MEATQGLVQVLELGARVLSLGGDPPQQGGSILARTRPQPHPGFGVADQQGWLNVAAAQGPPGQQGAVEKRTAYAGLGIPEYWRFDETGESHGTRLAGDRLVDGKYEPVPIETVGEGVLQGYSGVLNLLIRREHGRLGWHDTKTG